MNLLNQILKIFALSGSLFTIVLSPVAMGAQSVKNQSELEKALIESRLNQSMTYRDFWAQNKHLYSGQVYADAEKYFLSNSNEKMPVVKIKKSQNSRGEIVETLEMNQNGKTFSLQFIGEKEKFYKYNNVILSETDMALITPAIRKIAASDIKLKNELIKSIIVSPESKIETQKKLNQRVRYGFPELNQDTWMKLSQKDRAQYLINMRGMWNDSLKVLRAIEDIERKKMNSTKGTKTSQLESVIRLMQSEAIAQKRKSVVFKDSTKPTKPQETLLLDADGYLDLSFLKTDVTAKSGQVTVSQKQPGSKNCIIHGLVSEYVNGSCSESKVYDYYKSDGDKRVFEAIQICKSNKPTQMACNPYLYSNGTSEPICVDKSGKGNSDFQKGTHADGPCEKASPLGDNSLAKVDGTDFLIKDIKGPGRYSKDNLKSEVDLDKLYKAQQLANDEYVEKYLKGFLGKDFESLSKEKPISDDLLIKMKDIQSVFNSQISFARETCKASTNNPKYKQYDKNFWGACDQLQRRHLFIAQYLEKKLGCDGGKIDEATLKCMCPSAKLINPGAKCNVVAPQPILAEPAPVKSEMDCQKEYPGANSIYKDSACVCENGKTPRANSTSSFEEYPSSSSATYYCPSDFNFKPWLIGLGIVGVGVALWAIFKNKKKDKAPPKDNCPLPGTSQTCLPPTNCPAGTIVNPTTHVCDPIITPPSCQAPQRLIDGVCKCQESACVPGQEIHNAITCQCDRVGLYTCGDGSQVAQMSQCPTPTLCWNGSQVYPPNQCPAKTEGGSGLNNSDSGGIPGIGQ